ncbi:hypothetical protein HDV00_009504 [Rhizophlyctis rosea]|nr:hypothetical protein HDV00_009504 [Rhizophlyctis rosea]
MAIKKGKMPEKASPTPTEDDLTTTHPSIQACAAFLQPFMSTFTHVDYSLFDASVHHNHPFPPGPQTRSRTPRNQITKTLYAFHGTAARNIPGIFEEGFKFSGVDVAKANGSAYGPGVYLAKKPRRAMKYLGGGNNLIVAEVQLKAADFERRSTVVVRDKERVRPVAVVHLARTKIKGWGSAWRVASSKAQNVKKHPRIAEPKIESRKAVLVPPAWKRSGQNYGW